MITSSKSPLRLDSVLISICLILLLLYIGQGILIPIALAILFAVLLRPMVNFMQSKFRFPQILAVAVSLILSIAFVLGIIYFISFQVADMAKDWDKIKSNLLIHYANIQLWLKDTFGLSLTDQKAYLQQAKDNTLEGGKSVLGDTLNSFSGTLLNMVLVPLYTFLILIYRTLFLTFILKFFRDIPESRIYQTLKSIKESVHSFLIGSLLEMFIVATLTTIGLLILGVDHAVLLGVITGVLNLIPYIGILVAALITVVATLTNSTEVTTIIGVLVVNVIVQILDNNILVPLVVSSKVKINALMSIIIILIGGQLWGIAGMFLSIPAAAILKIIFDQVAYLEPWGFLIGDKVPDVVLRDSLVIIDSEAKRNTNINSPFFARVKEFSRTIQNRVRSIFK